MGVYLNTEMNMLINMMMQSSLVLEACVQRVIPPLNFGTLDQLVYLMGACDDEDEIYSAKIYLKQGDRATAVTSCTVV